MKKNKDTDTKITIIDENTIRFDREFKITVNFPSSKEGREELNNRYHKLFAHNLIEKLGNDKETISATIKILDKMSDEEFDKTFNKNASFDL